MQTQMLTAKRKTEERESVGRFQMNYSSPQFAEDEVGTFEREQISDR